MVDSPRSSRWIPQWSKILIRKFWLCIFPAYEEWLYIYRYPAYIYVYIYIQDTDTMGIYHKSENRKWYSLPIYNLYPHHFSWLYGATPRCRPHRSALDSPVRCENRLCFLLADGRFQLFEVGSCWKLLEAAESE